MTAKRMLDLVSSSVGLLLLAPLFVGVAAAVKIGDGGPVFFRQARTGQGGRTFWIWKFRTMVQDADRKGALVTVEGDRRITPVGRWLRKTKVDELPQLLNVLRGDMSLVGPRPEVGRYVDLYTEEQRAVLRLKPGITDPASIKYRNESELLSSVNDPERAYVEEIMPDKIRINLAYAQTATTYSDVKVVLSTVFPFINFGFN